METSQQQEPAGQGRQNLPEDAPTEQRKSYFTATSAQAPATSVTATADSAPAGTVSELPVALAADSIPITPAQPAPTPEIVPATASSAPAATTSMPKLQPFVLPLSELAEVAQRSGLTWVNSDAEKIAAVQAAIAAEPKPIQVRRERHAITQTNEESLVLVETKRDLRKLTLPFEAPQQN